MTHPKIDYIRQFVNQTNPKDEYNLISEIGSGTYGDVYKALHRRTSSFVAIKIMKIDLKDDVTAICQEIHTLRECKHVNIVQFYGSYLQNTKLWICMEYCGGQSMQDIYLNLRQAIEEDCIAFITRETLRGLEYMHRRGRIHRDIKGANILLTDAGDVKIADFGIAAKLSSTVAKRTTLIGTPYWMAPEVASVNSTTGGYDERCDVWAVGITAIEYAELQPPLFDLHPMKALQILAQKTYVPPKLQAKDLWTQVFHNFLKSALNKNEKRRPTCEELLRHDFVIRDHLSQRLTQLLIRRNTNDHKLPVYVPKMNDNNQMEQMSIECHPPPIIEKKSSNASKPIIDKNILNIDVEKDIYSDQNELFHHTEDDDFLISLDKELQKRGHGSLLKDEAINNSMRTSGQDNSSSSQHEKITSSLCDLNISTKNRSFSDSVASDIVRPPRPKSIANFPINNSSDNKTPRSDKPHGLPRSDVSRSELFDGSNQFSIPRIPKVHMGACFALMFEGCPLKINASGSWTNPETKEKLLLLGTNDGIYYLNTNEMHEKQLELLVPRRCLWLSIIKDTMLSLSGRCTQLYTHNLIYLIRLKNQGQGMNKLTNKLMPRRLRPSSKLADTKGCQMVSIIRNPFNGIKYMCAAVNKQVILYEWYSPRSTFIEIKKVDVPIMPCPLLNFDLLITREQNFPIVCLGVNKTVDPDRYKLNLVNLQDVNRSIWFQEHDSTDQLNVVKVLQIEQNILLICLSDRGIFVSLSGRVKVGKFKISCLEYGNHIESVVGLRDSILAFHTRGLRGIDFYGHITQDIYDDKHIYRLLSSDTYTASVLVESKPTEDPMNNANVYMLIGHQDQ